jgi:hypothetical protein
VNAASFSPDGARVVTASWDKTARVSDVVAPDERPLEVWQARLRCCPFQLVDSVLAQNVGETPICNP